MEDKELILDGEILKFTSCIVDLTIADSFVKSKNKIGKGSGEAKLYVGHDCSFTWDFFGPPGFEINCFILKKDLLELLLDLKKEYLYPTQNYRARNQDELSKLWNERVEKIKPLDDILWFEAYEQAQIRGNRVYIKSRSSYFELIREICLPNITNLIIDKYVNKYNHEIFRFLPKIKK